MKINNTVQILSKEIAGYYDGRPGKRMTGYSVLREHGLLNHPERLATIVVGQTTSGTKVASLVCRIGYAVATTQDRQMIWREQFDIGLFLVTVAINAGLYEARRGNGQAPSSSRSREPYYLYSIGTPSKQTTGYLQTTQPFPQWTDSLDEDGRQLIYSTYFQPEVKDSEWVRAVHQIEGIPFQINQAMLEVVRRVGLQTVNPVKLQQHQDILDTAQGLSGEPFYHRAHLDQRGRIYISRSPINFQQGDLSRGLLEFAEGVPLTDDGVRAIYLHIANCVGIKGDLQERIQYAKDQHETWLSYADGSSDEWLKASDPWQLLRACIELATVKVGDLTHLIVPIDQSCSGLAWQAIVMNDPDLAEMTNLNGGHHDLYSIIAEELDIPASASEKRQIIKRSVMPKSYGGGAKTIAKQLRKWATLNPDKAPYLNTLNLELIKDKRGDHAPSLEFLGIAQTAINTLETTAPATKLYAEAVKRFYRSRLDEGLEDIRWLSPSGFQCRIRKEKTDRVVGEMPLSTGRISIVAHTPTGKLDHEKMVTGSLANLIHSLDAALVHKTLACSEHQVVPVHDSFGSHPSNVFNTQKLLMENLCSIEQQDPSLSILAQDHDAVTWNQLEAQDQMQQYLDGKTTVKTPVVNQNSPNIFS